MNFFSSTLLKALDMKKITNCENLQALEIVTIFFEVKLETRKIPCQICVNKFNANHIKKDKKPQEMTTTMRKRKISKSQRGMIIITSDSFTIKTSEREK